MNKFELEGVLALEEGAKAIGREEGRQEILREIAKMQQASDADCHFCGANVGEAHEADCLWLRASQVPK